MTERLGAYVLTGDPQWLRSSLSRYYEQLDDLVVLVPESGLGWTGRRLPVDECLLAISEIDTRGITRTVTGSWVDPASPMSADTAQRQAGLNALNECTWVIQIDNDELIPDIKPLLSTAAHAAPQVVGIEWPMRVLFRRYRHSSRFLAVASDSRTPVYEYPGPVLIRPTVRLKDARRPEDSSGIILRLVMPEDDTSLQIRQAPAHNEVRRTLDASDLPILHNSWGRSPASVWRKVRTWGHSAGGNSVYYFLVTWLPSPWTWLLLRDVHPFAAGLWPRLSSVKVDLDLLHPNDH